MTASTVAQYLAALPGDLSWFEPCSEYGELNLDEMKHYAH